MVRIDKMVCEKPKRFRRCWMAIAVWMAACVVNAGFHYSLVSQLVLDILGGFILIIAMLKMFFSMRWPTPLPISHRRGGVFWMGCLMEKLLAGHRKLIKNVSRFADDHFDTVSKWFFGLCVLTPLFLFLSDLLQTVFAAALNIIIVYALLFFAAVVGLCLLQCLLLAVTTIYWAVAKHTGRIRRIGIYLILMAGVLTMWLTDACAESLINTMVIGCLSLFLYEMKILAYEVKSDK